MAGLTVAQILTPRGYAVRVFEQEQRPNSPRDQNVGQDMNRGSRMSCHQQDLIRAAIKVEFRSMECPEGKDLRILDKYGRVHWEEVYLPWGAHPIRNESFSDFPPRGPIGHPEADRPALRGLLIDTLRPGVIRWGHKLVAIERAWDKAGRIQSGLPLAGHVLAFENGVRVHAAGLLLGADGAQSLVRPMVTDVRPAYAGASFVELGIPDASRTAPECARTVGRGSMFALGDRKGIIAQLNDDGRIRVYAVFAKPGPDGLAALLDTPLGADPSAARAAVAAQFAGWAPMLVDLIRACSGVVLPRAIIAMLVGVPWPHQWGITLLGGAAHLMSPFAGVGTNLSMQASYFA